jgi:hypothetical protein
MRIAEDREGSITVSWTSAEDVAAFLRHGLPQKISKLHRYSRVSPHLLASLREGYLWFSSPGDFNDPLDCRFLLDYHLSEIAARRFLGLRRKALRVLARHKGRMTFGGELAFLNRVDVRFERVLSDHSSSYLNELVSHVKFADIVETMDKFLAVCCFARRPDEVLLWAHYAAQHTGICLGFQPGDKRSPAFDAFLPVKYRSTILRRRWYSDTPDEEVRCVLGGVLSKALAWSYEQEWRSFSFSGRGKKPFLPAELKDVIFGVNCTELSRNSVRDALAGQEYQHVTFKQAKLDLRRYRLRVVDA